MGRYSPSNMHAVLWDEAVMAPLPRQRVSAMDRRAFAMFNASPHCIWEPMKRLGAAGEWCACTRGVVVFVAVACWDCSAVGIYVSWLFEFVGGLCVTVMDCHRHSCNTVTADNVM